MSHRNLVILTKIILFYSLFYIVVKGFSIFRMGLVAPFLLLMIPFMVLIVISGWQVVQKRYSWIFVVIGAILIIAIRVFEGDLIRWFSTWW